MQKLLYIYISFGLLLGLMFMPFATKADVVFDLSLQDYLSDIGYSSEIEYTGKGAVIAIIDQGIDFDNDDLEHAKWVNEGEIPDNGIDDDKNGYVDDINGWDFVNETSDLSPLGSHGTMVAGIISAKHNDTGIDGIAPDAKLMSIIACDYSGDCPAMSVIRAILYAVESGADVINVSLNRSGAGGYSDIYNYAIKKAYDNGVLLVVSAGNGIVNDDGEQNVGLNLDTARSSIVSNDVDGKNTVIGVGALDMNGNKATWSNFGNEFVDVWAPGELILTTTVPEYAYGSEYEYADGTSFSAPMVSAAVALLLEKRPDASLVEIERAVTTDDNLDIKRILSDESLPQFVEVTERTDRPNIILALFPFLAIMGL